LCPSSIALDERHKVARLALMYTTTILVFLWIPILSWFVNPEGDNQSLVYAYRFHAASAWLFDGEIVGHLF
jgi:hypothetical protein